MRDFNYVFRVVILFSTLLTFSLPKEVRAQCTAPASISNPMVIHASCPGSGQITVGSVTPSAASISPDYYQYALYDTTGTTVVAPYQSSEVLVDIDAGIYDIYVRRVCSTGFSTAITLRVNVNNTEQMAFINAITLNRASQCNNGRFTVNASGSSPLEYAIVPSLSEPEPVAAYVRAPQSSATFDSLAAGTYYVRVYNACGNAVTQATTVPAYTTTTSFSNPDFFPLGCDSVHFRFYLNNYLRVNNTNDTAIAKLWLTWPTGVTDTLPVGSTAGTGAILGVYNNKGPLSLVDPLYTSSATFYENLSNYPYTFRYGYKDICGNIFTDSFILYEPTQKQLIMSINEANPLSNCDNVAYRFRILSNRPGLSPNQLIYHGFRNMHNFMYSVDSGLTWTNARISNSLLTPGSSNYSDYFQVARGVPVELRVAYCGDTLTHIFTPTAQPDLSATASPNKTFSCLGYGGVQSTKQNAIGDTLGYQMLTAPPGQPIIPYIHYYVGNLNGSSVFYIPEYQNLLPGSYTIRIWDSFGVDCPRFIDRTVNITPFALDFDFEQFCNGGLGVFEITPGQQLASYSYMRVKILDDMANVVLGPYTGSSPNPATTLIPAGDIASLPDGNYTVRVYKSSSSYPYLDTCSAVDKPWIKQPNLLNLTPSRFVPGCPGGSGAIVAMAQGGRAPYYFQLTDASSNVVTPTSPGSNIYDNLSANATYSLQVIDSCGTVVNRTMSVGEDLAVFIQDFATMPCPNDDVTLFVDSMPGIGYQWYKNGLVLTGDTAYKLFLPNIQNPADSGAYTAEITIGSCVVLLSNFLLEPGQCGTPLSVQLSNFIAYKSGTITVLEWTTLTEQNNEGFEVERSVDGKVWGTIAFVSSKASGGSSIQPFEYQYMDIKPLGGTNFYRLKQTDIDGSYRYSSVRKVSFGPTRDIQIFPNPARDYVEINGLNSSERIRFYDATGRLVKEIPVNSTSVVIPTSRLREGIYYVIVSSPGGNTIQGKLLKIK